MYNTIAGSNVDVSQQAGFFPKSPTTNTALVRMRFFVQNATCLSDERFVTKLARKRTFAGMSAAVPVKIAFPHENLGTIMTFEALFYHLLFFGPHVMHTPHVTVEKALFRKSFVANWASKQSLAMGQSVM